MADSESQPPDTPPPAPDAQRATSKTLLQRLRANDSEA
jgi:hypothetical protein